MYTFTGAILACAKAGQWPRALQLLSDARTELLLPDVLDSQIGVPSGVLRVVRRVKVDGSC